MQKKNYTKINRYEFVFFFCFVFSGQMGKSNLDSEFPFGLFCPFCSCNLQKLNLITEGEKRIERKSS